MELTHEQRLVADGVQASLRRGQQVHTIGGIAGTGKTVLTAALAEQLHHFAVCAFTGKAANVLRGKGVERAQTIHSLIYTPQEIVTVQNIVGDDGKVRQVTKRQVVYELRDDLDADGVLIDEASMVSGKLYADLSSFGVPLVFVGDHGQLEPVGEDIGLLADPQHRLETIHRNANEIAHFGGHLRAGRWASEWRFLAGAGDRVKFISPTQIISTMQQTEQAIVAFNAKRVELNRQYRAQVLGRTDNMPVVGDRLIVLRDTKRYRLFNGQHVTVEQVQSNKLIGIRTAAPRG